MSDSVVACVQLDDFDVMVAAIMDWGLENPVIFNCQLGIGRTTTGATRAPSLPHAAATRQPLRSYLSTIQLLYRPL